MSTLTEIEEAVPALRRYAGSLLRQTQDADDLVQDCLVRALDRLPERSGDMPVKPWLFAILHNLFISRWRSARRWRKVLHDPGPNMPDGAIEPPQEWSIAHRDLIRGLDTLPEPQRQVLLLVGVEQLEYSEVAAILEIPIGTVMSRLSRARDGLREHMAGHARQTPPRHNLRRVK
ncbi:MAG TPA: RNA polymerase sigma factor [Acetobacteraceae bacterium]